MTTTTLPRVNSIIVEALEWHDNDNGNSYFSAQIWVDNKLIARIPFGYGYGNQYISEAAHILRNTGYMGLQDNYTIHVGSRTFPMSLERYCNKNKIELTTHIAPALKREVVKFGKAQL